MVQQDKLVQFYFTQYRDSALKLKKKKNDGKSSYEKRMMGRAATKRGSNPFFRN